MMLGLRLSQWTQLDLFFTLLTVVVTVTMLCGVHRAGGLGEQLLPFAVNLLAAVVFSALATYGVANRERLRLWMVLLPAGLIVALSLLARRAPLGRWAEALWATLLATAAVLALLASVRYPSSYVYTATLWHLLRGLALWLALRASLPV